MMQQDLRSHGLANIIYKHGTAYLSIDSHSLSKLRSTYHLPYTFIMASIFSSTFALATLVATAKAQGVFLVSSVTSHQPTGAKDGSVDYYNMGFNVRGCPRLTALVSV